APPSNVTNNQIQMSGFAPLPALAGDAMDINGSGFVASVSDNQVFLLDAADNAVEAQVVSAANEQMRVLVPFGAGSGRALVSTPRGESRSAPGSVTLRTSVSGFVQDTARQGIGNVTVRVRGTSISATTNGNGAYVLKDVPPSAAVIEFDGT